MYSLSICDIVCICVALGRPKSIPHHNCPLYVKQDNFVSCVCSVDDLGSPPGQLKWNNTSSEQFVLSGVKMDQHGVNYVCSLTWNRTVVQSVTYTLLVACKLVCQ